MSEPASRVTTVLKRVRASLRRWAAVRGGSLLLLAMLAAIGLSFALDRQLRLDRISRAVVGLVLLAALVEVARRSLVRPLLAPLPDDDVALVLERRFPRLGQLVVSAVQFRRRRAEDDGVSDELVRHVEGHAESSVEGLSLGRIFRRRETGRIVLAAAAALVVAVILAGFFPRTAGLWFRRAVFLSTEEWPRRTQLVVEGFRAGVRRVPRGETVAVEARAEGVVPRRVEVEYAFADGIEGEATLADLTGGRFRHVFRDLVESVEFRLRGGDGVAGPLRIEVVDRPAAESMRLRLTFAPYLGREPEEREVLSGGIAVPEGTAVEVRARTRAPVTEASLRYDGDDLGARLVGPRDVEAAFRPETGGLLVLDLADADGFDSRPAVTVAVRVVPDAPPRATLLAPDVGPAVTPQAVLPLELGYSDDHGLTATLLEVELGRPGEDPDAADRSVDPVPGAPPGAREHVTARPLDLDPLGLEPGTAIRLVAIARDDDGIHGSKEGRSDPIVLRVVSRDDLLSEMIRRQQEIRRDLERVLERVLLDRKDLAVLAADLGREPPGPAAVESATEIARGQRRSGRRAAELAERFDRVLAEMRHNRLLSEAETAALAAAVPRPLERLASGLFPESARLTDEGASAATAEERRDAHGAAIVAYDGVIRGLRRVLEAMSRAEGFTELVERLRQVVRLEGEVRAATEDEYRRRIRELFPEDEGEDDR